MHEISLYNLLKWVSIQQLIAEKFASDRSSACLVCKKQTSIDWEKNSFEVQHKTSDLATFKTPLTMLQVNEHSNFKYEISMKLNYM